MNWYLKVWRQYADFSGRARRTEYWMFCLFNMLIMLLLYILFIIGISLESYALEMAIIFLYCIYALATIIPNLAVSVRRLHDVGKGGGWIFISLIPFIGGIWLLILMCTDSQQGVNKWGENPKTDSGDNYYRPIYNDNDNQTRPDLYSGTYEQKSTAYSKPTRQISTKITVGRNHSCDIIVDERYEDVSRNHITISKDGANIVLEDNSSFGTYINGQRVHHSQSVIRTGDEIKLGREYRLSWNEINKFFSDNSRNTERKY